jgi:hypothetical protein
MALQGPIPVEFGQAFPDGVYAAGGFVVVRCSGQPDPTDCLQRRFGAGDQLRVSWSVSVFLSFGYRSMPEVPGHFRHMAGTTRSCAERRIGVELVFDIFSSLRPDRTRV